MRLVLCVLLAMLAAGPAFADQRTLTRADAQAAAGSGDAQAAGALSMSTDQATCQTECTKRGHTAAQCTEACRPGFCHPDAEQPYCIK
jgi:hypothetical protein